MNGNGLKACETAFQRLRNGKPIVAAHIGIERSKITAGVVSVEAGFDRGYLKKSRANHLPLLAAIEAYRNLNAHSVDPLGVKYRRAKSRIHALEIELAECKNTMFRVLTQNLQLVESVRHLEQFIGHMDQVEKM